jgi:hypothetical protein
MDPAKYPPDWARISREVRARSGGRCECQGECGHLHLAPRCDAMNRERHPVTGSRVVLTVAHLCRCRDESGRKCGEADHLRAMCQRCHLSLDRADHIAHARVNRHQRRAVADLFPDAR